MLSSPSPGGERLTLSEAKCEPGWGDLGTVSRTRVTPLRRSFSIAQAEASLRRLQVTAAAGGLCLPLQGRVEHHLARHSGALNLSFGFAKPSCTSKKGGSVDEATPT